MGNIQNIQTIIQPYKMNIKMGEVITLHTNVPGHFGMVENIENVHTIVQLCEMCMYNHLTTSRTNRLAMS